MANLKFKDQRFINPMISKTQLMQGFQSIYQQTAETYYVAPGRVNLIGEHIDYHGGFVFPAAIHLGTYGVVRKRHDGAFYFYSNQYSKQGVIKVDGHQVNYETSHGWVNYMKGVLSVLIKKGFTFAHGLEIYIDSDLPSASGLSSSASIEMLMAMILNDQFQLNLSMKTLAMYAQEAERSFLGVQSGIMDQLSIALGKKDHAMFMDTHTLNVEFYPVNIAPYICIIMNTNYKRKLNESKYNDRVKETLEASNILQNHFPHEHLTELDPNLLKIYQEVLNHDILFRRVKHVILEQQRTQAFKKALLNHDINLVATLLDASHQSLKDDYEVTGKHLDLIVQLSKPYALGARMTGAGFGGCAIAIVHKNNLEAMKQSISEKYYSVTQIQPSFYEVVATEGVRKYE